MPGREVIAIGASAGGLQAVIEVVARLHAGLPASVFVVIHVPPERTSALPEILARCSPLPVSQASDGTPVQQGHIYVAPPDRHVILEDSSIRVVRTPRENGHRPAIDPLFRSAAHTYGRRAVGVVLSGLLDDGTAGLSAIRAHGGVAIVQDPADAQFPAMPENAIANAGADYVLPSRQIGALLEELVVDPWEEQKTTPLRAVANRDETEGTPAPFVCPDCEGPMWQTEDGTMQYRCLVGHRYSAESMLAHKGMELEDALWTAVRALEEKRELTSRLARRARARNLTTLVERYERSARDAHARAAVIRDVVENLDSGPDAWPLNLRPRPAARAVDGTVE